MRSNYSRRGQAIVLIVFAIIGLIAITALAIDGGNAFADRRKAQSAADNASLAAALAGAKKQNYQTAADALVQANGFSKDFCQKVVAILKRYDVNQRVSVWVQLPLKDGGISVLGHVDYNGNTIQDFERNKP